MNIERREKKWTVHCSMCGDVERTASDKTAKWLADQHTERCPGGTAEAREIGGDDS